MRHAAVQRNFTTSSVQLGVQAGILLGYRPGAGRAPKVPSLSGLLMGTFHRGDSEAKLVIFLDRQPIKGLIRAWGTGKQVSQNGETYSRPGACREGLHTATREGGKAQGTAKLTPVCFPAWGCIHVPNDTLGRVPTCPGDRTTLNSTTSFFFSFSLK